MSKPVKVGIFVLVGIALLCAGLFLIGSSSQLFGRHFAVYAQFNNVQTLASGATVRVGGMDAGTVAAIQIPETPSGKFRLKLSVDQKFRPIIRQDSMASIETQGFVGNEYIDIAKGKPNSPECQPGCTLPSQESISIGELMRQGGALVGQIQGTVQRADTAVENFSSVGRNANEMIEVMKPKVDEMSSNANAILASVRQGQGAAGELLMNKATGRNVASTIANAKQMSANLVQTSHQVSGMVSGVQRNDMPGIHKTVQNTEQLTGRLNQAVSAFVGSPEASENTAKAVRQTIAQAQQAMGNLADDTEALKTNFFFRGFFNRRGFYNMTTLTPSKYEATRFVKDPRIRVWISAEAIFEPGPNGSPEITQFGRTVLDREMSALVPYLPNNPIMVEGYSTYGQPDQQYLRSRERAIAVRDYLIQRFRLEAKRVGFMPLANQPPKNTGKQSWNGVCLVLVVSERR